MRGKSDSHECRKLETTRSNAPAGRSPTASAVRKSISRPRSAAAPAARAIAEADTSTAVTVQPCSASHTASAPSPQPISSAVPGGSVSTTAAVVALTWPDQTRSLSAYRSSQCALRAARRWATACAASSATSPALAPAPAIDPDPIDSGTFP